MSTNPWRVRKASGRNRARRARRLGRPPSRADLQAERDLQDAMRLLAPKAARALRDAMTFRQSGVPLRELTRAIERGDAREAARIIDAGNLGESFLRGAGAAPGKAAPVDRLMEALQMGGVAAQRQLPAREARLIGALDITNPEALRYVQETVPTLITNVNRESQVAIQQAIVSGFRDERSPARIARDIRRSIGLTPDMEQAVQNFRRQLESGEVGNATEPWRRRLSATEAQRARSLFNRPVVAASDIDELVDTYAQRLLNMRATTIATTEVHGAHVAGQAELWLQGVRDGFLDEDRARQFWNHAGDERVRDDHERIPGMNPKGVKLGEMFKTPVGPTLGPGQFKEPGQNINCRCGVLLRFI